jgi:hypothetical protein
MVDVKPKKDRKVEDPATHFDKPNDVVHDVNLSLDEKKKALNTWEQGARQLSTASSEAMTGSEEGAQPADHNRLGEVVRAKDKIGEKPGDKPAH